MAANLEEARQEVGKLLDANSEGMNPFRLLYNLEVLSSRLIPSSSLSIHSSGATWPSVYLIGEAIVQW